MSGVGPDGSVSAEYHKWASGDPDLSGLHVYIEKPGGEPVHSVEEKCRKRDERHPHLASHVASVFELSIAYR